MSLISARYESEIIEDNTDQQVTNFKHNKKRISYQTTTSTHLFHHPYYHYYDSTAELNDHLSKEAIYYTKLKYGYYSSPVVKHSDLNNTSDMGKKAAIFAQSSIPPSSAGNNYNYSSSYALDAATTSLYESNSNRQSKLPRSANPHTYQSNYPKKFAFKVYSDSLKPTNLPKEAATAKQNLNLSKVLTTAENKAHIRINKRYKPDSETVQIIRDKNALSAAYKVNSVNYLPASILEERRHLQELERQKLEIYNFMVSPKVWNLAKTNTSSKLGSIDDQINSFDNERVLFGNMDYNRKAVQYVQRQMELNTERENELVQSTRGKIYTGGGLWIPNRDIDQIARQNVKPMIEKIDLKTKMERKLDVELERREFTYKQEYERWKKLQIIRGQNDNDLVNQTNLEIERERRKNEILINEDMFNFSKEMENKLVLKQNQLNELIQKSKDLEVKLSNKKKNLKKWQLDQLTILQKEQDKELDKLNRDKMELVSPYFNTLKQNEDMKMKIQDEIDAIKIEIRDLKNEIQVHDKNILELDDRLKLEKTQSSSKNREQGNSNEKKVSIISIGRKGKAKSKKKHESLLISLDKEKHDQEKLVELKRAKLESLEKEMSEREDKLENNEVDLLKNKEKVDLLKLLKELDENDANPDKTSFKMNENSIDDDNISEYSQYDIIRRQNERAKEDDANVVQKDDYSEDDSIEVGEGNIVVKIHRAERAKNRGKPTIITTGLNSYQNRNGNSNVTSYTSKNSFENESSYGAEASASARSVTGVSGVLSEYPPIIGNNNRQSFRNPGKNKFKKSSAAEMELRTNYENKILQKPYNNYNKSRKQPTAVTTVRESDSLSKEKIYENARINNNDNDNNDSSSSDLKTTAPSFSGFSQGSIKDHEDQNKYIGTFSNDVHSLNESDRIVKGGKSLFKEIF